LQASSGAAALLPAILGGFKKQAQTQPAGLEGLAGKLGGLGGAGMLDEVLSSRPTHVGAGNDILGQIFGSKDVSRAVAQHAATRTGIDPSLLKKMLPVLVMLVGRSGPRLERGRRARVNAPPGWRRQSTRRHSRHGREVHAVTTSKGT
jgi:hypothetical protein